MASVIPNEVTPVSAGTLVLRARAGDGAAWEALTARYSGMLWAIARSYRLCRADAADVVQLTWLRLIENLGALRDPERIGAWLAVTARREAVRAARGAAVRVEAEWNAIPDPATPPDEHVAARERLRTVMAAIQTLPQLCQQTLRLFAASLSYAEVAAALGIPLGSVGPARTRCLAALRKLLGGAA
jgi:RNA polymerase sigma factor (sigma-70 family)